MQQNIFRYEVSYYLRSTLVWTIVLILVATLYLSFYPSLVEQTTLFAGLIESFPAELKDLLGITPLAVTSLAGYLGFIFIYVILLGAIQSMNLGTAIFAKEISGKTAEFLMTKPISRQSILVSKMLAGFSLIVVTNIVFSFATYLLSRVLLSNPLEFKLYILIAWSLFFVQLFFLVLGFLLGIGMRKIRNVIAVTLPVVFGFYVVGMLDAIVGKDKIGYLTPFKFFNVEYINTNSNYEWQYLIFELVLIIVALYFCRRIYLSKDIHSV